MNSISSSKALYINCIIWIHVYCILQIASTINLQNWTPKYEIFVDSAGARGVQYMNLNESSILKLIVVMSHYYKLLISCFLQLQNKDNSYNLGIICFSFGHHFYQYHNNLVYYSTGEGRRQFTYIYLH